MTSGVRTPGPRVAWSRSASQPPSVMTIAIQNPHFSIGPRGSGAAESVAAFMGMCLVGSGEAVRRARRVHWNHRNPAAQGGAITTHTEEGIGIPPRFAARAAGRIAAGRRLVLAPKSQKLALAILTNVALLALLEGLVAFFLSPQRWGRARRSSSFPRAATRSWSAGATPILVGVSPPASSSRASASARTRSDSAVPSRARPSSGLRGG